MKTETGRESEVQAGILAYLGTRPDILFWRQNVAAFSPRPGAFIRAGMKGLPDILAVQAPTGRFIGVEVKREKGGKLSPVQEAFGRNLQAHGGVYVVARSIEDVEKVLGPAQTRVGRPSKWNPPR